MTAIHVHALAGCTPTPLARYLKALAVLRLVSEQKDAGARGFFRDDIFHLATSLDREELERFFVEEYRPTPLVTPWNGGSGFYPGDNRDAIETIANSEDDRFAAYRETIAAVRGLVGDRDKAPKEDEKLDLLGRSRSNLATGSLAWINAAVAIAGDADGRTGYPALLGTGGNDGRLEFVNNFMQRLHTIILRGEGRSTIGGALFDDTVRGLASAPIGQFDPGGAGGANASSSGFEGGSLVNPWDYVLMLEGAIVLGVATARRLDASTPATLSGPFTVRPSAAGFASAAGDEQAARGEQWMPIWNRPASLGEVRALFAQGRMLSGSNPAQRAVDAARSVARLGVARGVGSFERYGYLERNGRSNLAVPLGRWTVPARPPDHIQLVDEVAPWIEDLRRAAGSKEAPTSLQRDLRQIEDAIFDVCRGDPRPERWERLLLALGQAEANFVARAKAIGSLRLQPLPRLSMGWIAAAYQPTRGTEMRLAAALASQTAHADWRLPLIKRLGPIRVHCLPLDPRSYGREARFAVVGERLANDPRVVWHGRDLVTDLGALVIRRLMEAEAAGLEGLGLTAAVPARLDDVAHFVAGHVDDTRIAALARGLMAVEFERFGAGDLPWRWERSGRPDAALAMFHALYRFRTDDTHAISAGTVRAVRPDPGPARRLLAGDISGAAAGALARLRAMGVRPRVHTLVGSDQLARRLAASLAFPLSAADVRWSLHALAKSNEEAETPASQE